MDRANHALAMHLARDAHRLRPSGRARAWPDLAAAAVVRFHPVRGRSGPPPRRAAAGVGRGAPARLLRPVPRDCRTAATPTPATSTWVHYLHAAHEPQVAGFGRRAQSHGSRMRYYARAGASGAPARARSSSATASAPRTTCTSAIGVDAAGLRVVYYGSDAAAVFARCPTEERALRRALGWPLDRPVALFVGALGDRRKGFDRLFEAWTLLCRDPAWDADLVVAGHGSELAAWQRRAAALEPAGRITFLGFRTDISRVIAAADVHGASRALRGVRTWRARSDLPRRAGDRQRRRRRRRALSAITSGLLIADVEDAPRHRRPSAALAIERARPAAERVRPLAERLRSRSWGDMGAEIEQAVTA